MTSAAELPASAGSNLTPPENIKNTKMLDPLRQATGVYVTVHGHFYQPPRENPYLDSIERQPGAAPFHDWNERIHHECYRPNAFARVLNDRGELVGIVNNYEYLSFNIGPTLMSWLERHDVEVYQRILEADRKSSDRLNGHGNAIAQVYNHIIMPLANDRDKYTQIRWGKEDFRSRFGRDPEGMWLAETAVDYATLQALVDEGIRFIVLAPSQAQRCRLLPTKDNPNPEWHEVGGNQIDPTRPYRCFLQSSVELSDGASLQRPYIDIFFYDGPISRDMGFSDVLFNSSHLAGRIGSAVRGDHRPAQLISVGTDGETFGHHKGGTEKTLAYAFTKEFPHWGWTVTNFAHYLSLNTPTWEVELKPVTAWSCAHGVDRWQDDCGCGGGGSWHQKWRRPLRDALNWLRDRLILVYEEHGKLFFRDPWQARDEYIQVIRDRSPENVSRFLSRHQTHKLSSAEQVDALRLLEMQRHALLMFTSCGWFFEELSRPEGTQILRYAARALELAGDVAGVQLEKGFVKRLNQAISNVDLFKHGGEVYRQLVLTAQVSFKQVAAQYALTSLFANHKPVEALHPTSLQNGNGNGSIKHSHPYQKRVYCYTANEVDYQLQRMGSLTLAVGHLSLVSEITWESEDLVFAVLHLGGWDFHCCIQPFQGRRAYTQLKEKLFGALQQASAAHMILVMTQLFGEESFSLQNLFAEERHRLMHLLSQETLSRLDQLYTQAYRDNYGVLMAFHRDGLPAPQELQVAAEIALGYRCMMSLRLLEQDIAEPVSSWNHIVELEAIATEAKHLHCHLNIPEGKQMLEQLILRSLWQLLHDPNGTFDADLQRLERLIDVANQLNLGISLERSQELYYSCLYSQIVPVFVAKTAKNQDTAQCRQLLKLGQKLAVDVSPWLSQLG
ncbi:glycoside hydrolase family protein [Kalymmatonema gypsitolerans NIES-4073]|nr:glycoside hydrolase family protein [Scytonema sp. NIES-4073]